MNAMVFAAGLGSRLAPVTDSRPKALVEVGGKTVLERAISAVVRAGARRVVVNVHHFAPMVKEFIASRTWPAEILISDESDRLLDTGGGLLKARRLFESSQPILLHNADIVSDIDLSGLNLDGADALLVVSGRESSRKLIFDKNGRLTGWKNMSSGELRGEAPAGSTAMPFSGIHLVAPSIFSKLEEYACEGEPFSLTPFYIANATRLDIRAWRQADDALWHDIGTPQKLAAARQAFR